MAARTPAATRVSASSFIESGYGSYSGALRGATGLEERVTDEWTLATTYGIFSSGPTMNVPGFAHEQEQKKLSRTGHTG